MGHLPATVQHCSLRTLFGSVLIAPSPAATEALLRYAAESLPGCVAYENRRPVVVPAAADGWAMLEMLRLRFPEAPPGEWEARCAAGRFLHPAGRALHGAERVPAGMTITQVFPGYTEPAVATDIRVVHEDDALLVLDKPAPLPMHPSGRYNRNTLRHFLQLALDPPPLHAHRLDANTTGLVALAKSKRDCHALQRQFQSGTVTKTYLARASSCPAEDRFVIDAPIDRAPGPTGVHLAGTAAGKPARTVFRVLRRDADGSAVLEADLETGRTNQIRIHLWHMGHPLCGDPSYLPGGRIGDIQTLPVCAPPLCLHAWRLAFHHPRDGRTMTFVSPRDPGWLKPR